VDKRWKKLGRFFIHKVPTGHGVGAHELLAYNIARKLLIRISILKLCTSIMALNNNNKLTISNIY